ncbi:MAG: DUF3084 domain-containing protein [Phascolarctobacterium sp.]|nr:DUF3084 domain-containing protein [Phascolarctobacterium sp.]
MLVGIRLIIVMAIVGGLIAYIADHLGSKIGKKRITLFGLRPKYTSILLTVLSGVIISVLTIGVMTVSSESARVALFGMDKIREELKSLNEEKEKASVELADAQGKVEEQTKTIADLDAKILESSKATHEMEERLNQINSKYDVAQAEVASLTDVKNTLTTEVSDLEKVTEQLRQGIVNMREGQVYYRAGEIIHQAVMRAGLKHDQNVAQVNWLLKNANQATLERLHVQVPEDKNVQAIWISANAVNDAVKRLDNSKGNMLYRVRAAANIIVGELAVCEIEMTENQFIFPDKSLMISKEYNLNGDNNYDLVMMDFLQEVNRTAVASGVLPDPLTGKVGNMDMPAVLEATQAMRKSKGRFIINAYAKGDITTAGPVKIRMEVVPLE